eukprot:scpid42968/ scgid0420/ Homeobox protein unc-62; Uncoordinated protein 62
MAISDFECRVRTPSAGAGKRHMDECSQGPPQRPTSNRATSSATADEDAEVDVVGETRPGQIQSQQLFITQTCAVASSDPLPSSSSSSMTAVHHHQQQHQLSPAAAAPGNPALWSVPWVQQGAPSFVAHPKVPMAPAVSATFVPSAGPQPATGFAQHTPSQAPIVATGTLLHNPVSAPPQPWTGYPTVVPWPAAAPHPAASGGFPAQAAGVWPTTIRVPMPGYAFLPSPGDSTGSSARTPTGGHHLIQVQQAQQQAPPQHQQHPSLATPAQTPFSPGHATNSSATYIYQGSVAAPSTNQQNARVIQTSISHGEKDEATDNEEDQRNAKMIMPVGPHRGGDSRSSSAEYLHPVAIQPPYMFSSNERNMTSPTATSNPSIESSRSDQSQQDYRKRMVEKWQKPRPSSDTGAVTSASIPRQSHHTGKNLILATGRQQQQHPLPMAAATGQPPSAGSAAATATQHQLSPVVMFSPGNPNAMVPCTMQNTMATLQPMTGLGAAQYTTSTLSARLVAAASASLPTRVSMKSVRQPILPGPPKSTGGTLRLPFTIEKPTSPERTRCSICGTLACGSRSALTNRSGPPRRHYFSCKVARRRLQEWMDSHQDHPYPTKSERAQLLKETGMSRVQLQNWFGNHRRRLKSQRLHDGTSPHDSKDCQSDGWHGMGDSDDDSDMEVMADNECEDDEGVEMI